MDRLPNIAEMFDLFPYVMYLNQTVDIGGTLMNEFKYSYPLGNHFIIDGEPDNSHLLAYFNADTMDLDRIIIRANSLNIT